jgi:hypothetical protein
VPLSAFLPGVTKNSISQEVFQQTCPENQTVHINLAVRHEDQWNHANEVLAGDERCVVVDDWIFNWGCGHPLLDSILTLISLAFTQIFGKPWITSGVAILSKVPSRSL